MRFFATLLFAVLGFCPDDGFAQQQFTDYQELEGEIQVGPTEDITVERTERGYTLLLPENEEEIRGLVVVFEGRRRAPENISEPMKLHPHAFEQGLGMLYVSTGHPVDFYFEDESMLTVRDLILKATLKHNLPANNLSYVGFSLGGTQALKFTVFCQEAFFDVQPDARLGGGGGCATGHDAFWRATERAERVDFHPLGAGEGRWVSHWLEKNLGGKPHENPEAYVEYSPYTYTWERVDKLGGNAQHLKDISVRTYTEPDVKWSIAHRRKSYYSKNAIDMAALVNDLKIMGNDEAEFHCCTAHNL